MARQPAKLVGLTQASTVKGKVGVSKVFGNTILPFVPSKDTALPYLPVSQVAPFPSVPSKPLPEASIVVVPVPSLKPKAACSPWLIAAPVAKVKSELAARLPEASFDLTLT